MSYKYSIYALLFFAVQPTCPMDPPMPPPIERTYPIDFPPMGFADDPKDDLEVIPSPIKIEDPDVDTFEGMNVQDLHTVLEQAPDRPHIIVDELKQTNVLGMPYRSHFFVGNPGVGKTVLAKAIAHKGCPETPYSYEYISSSAFARPYRNHTGIALRDYLKKIVKAGKPILLIIDQLNKIMEYTKSTEDDTAMTSSVLTNFLDSEQRNENVFFIGIMDRATNLSENLKHRMGARTTFLKKPVASKRIIFTSKCINESTQLHPEVTNEWLERFLEDEPTITGRNYRGLALQVHEILQAEEDGKEEAGLEVAQITKRHLQTALESYKAARKDVEHVDPYEARIDKMQRLHTESLFAKFLASDQLPLLEVMLKEEKSMFLKEQRVLLRKLLEKHNAGKNA
jgi:SpoVK/Ycf46/Vps4 family AAA+-type ATPase